MGKILRYLISATAGAAVIIAGCRGLERKLGEGIDIETAKQRDGMSEYGWEFQIKNLVWREDPEGFWQSPKVTLERRGGDCEDFAILSAFYSGNVYGNNVMILKGKNIKTGKAEFHAIHLLEKDGKFGSRGGHHKDNIELKKTLKEVIIELQHRRNDEVLYDDYAAILNLDVMNPDWRTTEKDLSPDYLRVLKERKAKIIYMKDLK